MCPVCTVWVFLLGLALAIGCRSSHPSLSATCSEPESQASPTRSPSERPTPQLLGIYTGTLPCVDCRGIRTELSLYVKAPNHFSEATGYLR
jgi:uncharacterized lipoprotein NlpE involved in copper resistance